MKEFEEERERLMKALEEKRTEMKGSQWEEEIDLKKGFDAVLLSRWTSTPINLNYLSTTFTHSCS